MTRDIQEELQRLLSALCDGELTESQHARLEELLQADTECRLCYIEYVDMHARLLSHPHLEGDLPRSAGVNDAAVPAGTAHAEPITPAMGPAPSAAVPRARAKRWRQVPVYLRYGVVAAATLAASLLIQLFWRYHPSEIRPDAPVVHKAIESPVSGYVATLTQSAGCVWENAGERWGVGSRLLAGELRLRAGVARIRFDGGTDLVVEAPAQLRLESSTSAVVLSGKVVFSASETAAPFDLHTPSSTLVDLGTEYALVVDGDGEEIQVFDGEVQRTPKVSAGRTEHLTAGEARRYGRSPDSPGQRTVLTPVRFVRHVFMPSQPPLDPSAGLIAYEGFDYRDAVAFSEGEANGGVGWLSPWTPGFARPLNESDQSKLALNVNEGLVRRGALVPSIGGCVDYTGFTKYFRQLATPVRLDEDGVYYLSFLFRRHGPPADQLNAVAVLLRTTDELAEKPEDSRKRLNIGVGGSNELFTHLQRVGSRTPLPLSYGQTYLLVAKIVASSANADQVFMRVYGPDELIEPEEPGSWSVVGPPLASDLVFDWLEVHINSRTRQSIDEVRVGTTWSSVTVPWIGVTP
jgi:negative regulator of sigma E activity